MSWWHDYMRRTKRQTSPSPISQQAPTTAEQTSASLNDDLIRQQRIQNYNYYSSHYTPVIISTTENDIKKLQQQVNTLEKRLNDIISLLPKDNTFYE